MAEPNPGATPGGTEPGSYVCARVQAAIAGDDRAGELAVDVREQQGILVLTGIVANDERRRAIEAIARETAPEFEIRNDLDLVELAAPARSEPL